MKQTEELKPPTAEQQVVIDALLGTKDNLLVNALAGTGKTTMLCHLEQAWKAPCLYLAFTRRDKDEAKKRLKKAKVQNWNGLGYGIWTTAVPGTVVNKDKTREQLTEKIKTLKGEDREAAWDEYYEIASAINLAKNKGYIPNGTFKTATPLIDRPAFIAALDFKPSPLALELIDSVLTESIRFAFKGNIDFDDQIYMPALFGGTFPRYPLVLVDEGQDQSPVCHQMLQKLAKGRLGVVGDRWQSIYAFRGAVTSGIEKLKARFDLHEFPLSVSFRCPKVIVEAARWRVPHFQWIKDGGRYEHLQSLSISEIPDGAAIICRNNAPLFKLAFQLLREGRSVSVLGSEIGPRIARLLKKIGVGCRTSEDLQFAIEDWRNEKLANSNSPGTINDQADCMKVFASFGKTLDSAIAYTEALFKERGAIQLLTGHKSKGGEWDTVYHLDPWLIGEDEQDQNLRYVITTRAKQSLFEINSKDIHNAPQ